MSMATIHEQTRAARVSGFESYPKTDSAMNSRGVVSASSHYAPLGCGVDENNNEANSPPSSNSDVEERNWDASPDHNQSYPDETGLVSNQDTANDHYMNDVQPTSSAEEESPHMEAGTNISDPDRDSLHISEERSDDVFIKCVDEQEEIEVVDGGQEESMEEDSPYDYEGRRNSPVCNNEDRSEECKDSPLHGTLEGEKTIIGLNGFSHYFTHNLYTLQHRQLFCDVTIKASDTVFQAHKVVLAACSPYFYDILQRKQGASDVETTNEDTPTHAFIDLGTSVSGVGLSAVIDCMYTSKIALDRATVNEVLQAASSLSMQLVVEACFKFMRLEEPHQAHESQNESPKIPEEQPADNDPNDAFDLSVAKCRRSSESSEEKLKAATNPHRGYPDHRKENSTPDPENSTIYQSISPRDVTEIKSSSPKSINWKKYKYITQNHQETAPEQTQTPYYKSERNTSNEGDVPAPFLPENGARVAEEDDDVFLKKSTPREPKFSADLMQSPFHKFDLEHHSKADRVNSFAADLIRRHQRDAYSHVMTNPSYMLNPETMAAAMAMTSLTTSLRSPANGHFLPGRGERPNILTPWQHLLSQRYSQLQADTNLRHSVNMSNRPLEAHKLQQQLASRDQNLRQHAYFFGGLRPRPNGVYNPHQPAEHRPESGAEKAMAYNPTLLKNLLRKTSTDAPPQSLKRSFSTESNGNFNGNTPANRFSAEHPYFVEASEAKGFHNSSLLKADTPCHQAKHRRSTNSTSSGSPDRPYKCLVCAAEFNRPANLKTHMRIHSGEKPYKCQSCGARFVQVAHLRAHILIHTGEKPYPCKVCGTRFRHLQTLKSHLRIHTGEKPYACDECNVRFRHKSQLRLHLRTKHGINTNTKKTYQQVPGLRSADISAHIKRTQEAVRMQAAHKKDY